MSVKVKINIIVACSENNGIGIAGRLPWSLKQEMKYFSRMTKTTNDPNKTNAVIMGKNTWLSIPEKFRPLAGRINFLVSTEAAKAPEKFPGCQAFESFSKALQEAETQLDKIETVWIIGGASIYKAGVDSDFIHRVYLTRIKKHFECDTFFPELPQHKFRLAKDPSVSEEEQTEGDISYSYQVYEKIN